jgi:hypothetical protein
MRRVARLCSWIATLLIMCSIATAQQLSIKPVIGGFPADSGFSAGAEVVRTHLLGPFDGRIKAVASVKKYELLEVGADVPELRPWLSLKITAGYHNYPQDNFWGLGNNTRKDQRTNYLIEAFDTTTAFQMSFGKFRGGISGGYLKINTGPGRDKDVPSVPESLQLGPSYGHAGASLEYGALDDESDPHKGGKYAFQWTTYASSFQRYEVAAYRFVPITATDRVGLRALTTFIHNSPTETVPFFMLPTVGGSDTVRGFNHYRFRDGDALVLNAEYRRPLNAFVDAVAFVDAGRVFSRAADLGLSDLHYSGGFGARLKFGQRVLIGIDLGFSREGARLWFRTGQMF